MANFNSNTWYHIYFNEDNTTALMGSQLFNQTLQAGTTFFQSYNYSDPDPAHHWQLYKVYSDPDFYVMRTKASGADGFLATRIKAEEDTQGNMVPRMIRGNVSDDSVFWLVSPWGDGSSFLSNKANKTDWHLTRKDNSLAAMTSNITGDKPGQHFLFEKISAINDEQYSTVELPSMTGTPAPGSDPKSTNGTGDSEGTEKSGGGLSDGAKAGIGAGIGLLGLILLVVGALFLWRRSRRNKTPPTEFTAIESDKYTVEDDTIPAYELQHSEAAKYEAYSTPHAELHHDPRPVELPGALSPEQGHVR